MMTEYERLKSIIDEIDVLIDKKVSSSDPEFEAWQTKTERFLISKFGQDSIEYKKFNDTSFSLMLFTLGTPHSDFVDACISGLEQLRQYFLHIWKK